MKLVLFLFIISLPLYAGRWTVKKKTPYEMKALVESFNLDYLTEEEKKGLEGSLATLDKLMLALDERDRFFIAKSTIYKWILKNSPNVTAPKSFNLYDFKTAGKEKKLNNFAKWLLMALKADAASITSLPTYNSYLEEKKKFGKSKTYSSLEKRIDLIKPWAYLYTRESADQISLRLIKYQFNLLNSLISQYKLFYRFKGLKVPSTPSTKLAFFTFDDGMQKPTEEEDKVLNRLDEIIAKHKKEGLPLPKNDWEVDPRDEWKPKEDLTLSDKSLMNLKNPEVDPNYKAPANLPKPVNDWIFEE